jgi:hypothetical protein
MDGIAALMQLRKYFVLIIGSPPPLVDEDGWWATYPGERAFFRGRFHFSEMD